jgi:hypothetical protein
MKRALILFVALATAVALVEAQRGGRPAPSFTVVEATIADMRIAMEQKRVTDV